MSANPAVRGLRGSIFFLQNRDTPIFWNDGAIFWSRTGRITAAGPWNLVRSAHATIPLDDRRGHLIIPGFVDCHVHLPQLDCRHKSGYTLLDWLDRYIFPAEARFADPTIARDTAVRFFHELLCNGTTTALIFSTIHEKATDIAFQEAEACGIRAIIGKVLMDQHSPPTLTEKIGPGIAASERLIARWHGKHGRLFYAMTPRFALTCSEEALTRAGQLAKDSGCYFQTHIAETIAEVDRAREIFHTSDYVGLFAQCGCLGPRSVFAHAIYLTNAEWQQIAASKSAIAHCPSSNIFLQSGRMPIEAINQYQITCGLGSDVGAGPEFSLWDVMQSGVTTHTPEMFSPLEAFYRATIGGAAALGLENNIGKFATGYAADMVVYKNMLQNFSPTTWLQDFLSNWKHYPVATTYVLGNIVYTVA